MGRWAYIVDSCPEETCERGIWTSLISSALSSSILTVLATGLDLGVRVQKATAHANGNVAPGIPGNVVVKDQIPQERYRHLVEGTDNGIGGGSRRLDAVETGKIQKESDKTGPEIFGKVGQGVDAIAG